MNIRRGLTTATKACLHDNTSGPDQEGLFTGGGGGAHEAKGLKRAAQAVSGGRV